MSFASYVKCHMECIFQVLTMMVHIDAYEIPNWSGIKLDVCLSYFGINMKKTRESDTLKPVTARIIMFWLVLSHFGLCC